MTASDSPLRSVKIVLDESHVQLMTMEDIYQQTLDEKLAPARVLALAKGALVNFRSALDYIAYELLVEYGTVNKQNENNVQYPLCNHPNAFDGQFDRKLPGVRRAYPPAAELVRVHQPFQPNHEWMTWLSEYVNPNKHRRLTAQTRVENHRIQSGGVSWDPGAVTFGAGVFINGSPVDPTTQRPEAGSSEVTYVDWLFEGSDLSVRSVLRTIGAGIRGVVADYETELGW